MDWLMILYLIVSQKLGDKYWFQVGSFVVKLSILKNLVTHLLTNHRSVKWLREYLLTGLVHIMHRWNCPTGAEHIVDGAKEMMSWKRWQVSSFFYCDWSFATDPVLNCINWQLGGQVKLVLLWRPWHLVWELINPMLGIVKANMNYYFFN